LQVSLTFIPKDRRHYDLDNLIARCKPYQDGIADALGINDRTFGYGSITLGEPEKPGKVIVRIT
jgi:hypothetical protein